VTGISDRGVGDLAPERLPALSKTGRALTHDERGPIAANEPAPLITVRVALCPLLSTLQIVAYSMGPRNARGPLAFVSEPV
jgi:hypothetical protein